MTRKRELTRRSLLGGVAAGLAAVLGGRAGREIAQPPAGWRGNVSRHAAKFYRPLPGSPEDRS
jgi:hypothetical protein